MADTFPGQKDYWHEPSDTVLLPLTISDCPNPLVMVVSPERGGDPHVPQCHRHDEEQTSK